MLAEFEHLFTPEPNSGCFLWTGKKSASGYGRIHRRPKWFFAHRLIYTKSFGEIPEGLVVRHRCDQRLCVNPDHLLIGTPADNIADMISRGRMFMKTGGSRRGSKNTRAKLTEEMVLEIRELSKTMSQADIALFFGVGRVAINNICTRKSWGFI